MRIKNSRISNIFTIFLTVVFVLGQAVFLLPISSLAQTTGTTSIFAQFVGTIPSPARGDVLVQIRVNQSVSSVQLNIKKPSNDVVSVPMTLNRSGNYEYLFQTTNHENGVYYLSGRITLGSLSVNTMAPSELIVEVDNPVLTQVVPEVSLQAPSANEVLSGATNIVASVNISSAVLTFLVHNENNVLVAQIPGSTMSTAPNIYNGQWDTIAVPDGRYKISARVEFGTEYVDSIEVVVQVENQRTAISPELFIQSPPPNTILSGDFLVKIKTNFESTGIALEINPGQKRFVARPLESVSGDYYFTFNWDTVSFVNGPYTITAKVDDTVTVLQKSSIITIDNPTTTNTTVIEPVVPTTTTTEPIPVASTTVTTIPNTTPATTTTTIQYENEITPLISTTSIEIKAHFEDSLKTITTPVSLFVITSVPADNVSFIILETNKMIPARKVSELRWEFMERSINEIRDGEYTIKTIVKKDDRSFIFERTLAIDLLSDVQEEELPDEIKAPDIVEEEEPLEDVTINIITPETELGRGLIKLGINTTGEVEKVVLRQVFSTDNFVVQGEAVRVNDGYWEFDWDTTNLLNDHFSLDAVAVSKLNNKFISKIVEINIVEKNSAVDKSTEESISESKEIPIAGNISTTSNRDVNSSLDKKLAEDQIYLPAVVNKTVVNSVLKSLQDDSSGSLNDSIQTLSARCLRKGIVSPLRCEAYLANQVIPLFCKEAGITNSEECDKYTYQKFEESECQKAGLANNECRKFLINRFSSGIECRTDNAVECGQDVATKHVEELLIGQTRFADLKQSTQEMIGSSVKITELEAKLGVAKDIIPLVEQNSRMKIMAARDRIVYSVKEGLVQTPGVVMVFDADGDGLTDDLEKRLGTDPYEKDTDGDGYFDGDEIRNGYNPRGDGGFMKNELAPIDNVFLNGIGLEHPKTEGKMTETLAIDTISNLDISFEGSEKVTRGYSFTGKATPNSVVTLYVYSELPLVTTVKSDEFGNWEYELSESLTDGDHEIYVAINDNTGKVISKSSPFSFIIKEARAVSIDDFVPTAMTETPSEAESTLLLYMLIASVVSFIGILLFVIFYKINKKKQEV